MNPAVEHRTRRVVVAVLACTAVSLSLVAGMRPALVAGLDTTATTNPWLGRRVLAIAHAGGEDEAPHSTMFAYKRAVSLGVSMIDLDVQITADGVPVVIHNDTVDRTTNGTGSVSAMTFAQVHALDAAYWFTATCWACTGRPAADYIYRGMRTGAVPPPPGYVADDFAVPSVEQVFQQFPDAYIDIEIKGTAPASFPAADALAELIDRYGRADRTVVASFDTGTLDHFSAVAPEVPTSATLEEVTRFFLDRQPIPHRQVLDVPPFYDLNGTEIEVVTPQFVEDAHRNGLAVWVWMDSHQRENADFYNHLIDMGVDGINAARPGLLVDTLTSRSLLWDGSDPLPTTSTTAPPPATAPTDPPAASPATAVRNRPTYTG